MGTNMFFKGHDFRNEIPDSRIINIIRPIRPSYERNKVVIPGKDGTYDFGNNRKEDFLITVEIAVEAESASQLQDRLALLATFLDGKGNLYFSDAPTVIYTAQVYDTVTSAGDPTARWSKGLIVFECDAGGD